MRMREEKKANAAGRLSALQWLGLAPHAAEDLHGRMGSTKKRALRVYTLSSALSSALS
jgi:hypothetical protein